MTVQLLMGMPERELVKKEMVNLICVSDRTHSQLFEAVPERSSSPWSQVCFRPVDKGLEKCIILAAFEHIVPVE